MRVQQSKLPLSWLQNSGDIVSSIYSFMMASPYLETLIDDGGLGTKVAPLSGNTLGDTGIAFMAKDSKTMLSGLRAVGSGGRRYQDAYRHQGARGSRVAAVAFSWDSGSTRRTSKISTALMTVKSNVVSRVTRSGWLESVSDNMAKVSRDGLMMERGTIVFVCPAETKGGVVNHQNGKFKLHTVKYKCARELHMDQLADLVSSAY